MVTNTEVKQFVTPELHHEIPPALHRHNVAFLNLIINEMSKKRTAEVEKK